jgi:transcriptional regulator with XRE-family HTH domain
MALSAKPLQPLDSAIARILAAGVIDSGLTRRALAERTGMSANRIGIILREEQPPATVGEVGMIAEAIGTDASSVIRMAERATPTGATVHMLAPVHVPSDHEVEDLITLNPAASDPAEGYDSDAEVEAQQDQP